MASTMGKIIKELRKKSGFTQEELAERLGVTYQAVSKWESGTGMPDISQIVPLASIFKVTTDVLFGVADTIEEDEVWETVKLADRMKEYGNIKTYLAAYDLLLDTLKKYPGNLFVMINCMQHGIALALPENGWLYAKERAKEIASETIRQANFVIANSKHIPSILFARQILIHLYCSQGKFDLAINECDFPIRTDLTACSNHAIIKEYMKDYKRAAESLCTDIDYMLQGFENNIARLGKAYYNDGKYADAIAVYERFFEIMRVIFKDELPLSYHDFDSGDCYLLLAEAYLAAGDTAKAMDAVEKSVMYYIDLCNAYEEEKISPRGNIKSPIVRETELVTWVTKDTIKRKLLDKLSEKGIQSLANEARFAELVEIVNDQK
ncbi:MAG: helix-turn-helix transcriptional regulator [Clostridia bacterium]|nr:helix-turn-helix transcriptional regulator [Clostridia bacterium]